MLLLIWSRRQLLIRTIGVTLRQRYAGTVLGLSWMVLGPLILLSLYAVLYLVIFKIRPVGMEPHVYVLYIFSGLVPFLNFSQGLVQGSLSLSANRELLLNTVYPPELVPVREIGVMLVTLMPGLAIICIGSLLLGNVNASWLLLPVIILLMTMFLIALTWVLSLANLVIKDIEQILTYITIMLLIASPIAYTPDMVPGALRVLIYINPLAYFVICFQYILVLGIVPPWPILAGTFVFGIGAFILGAWTFSRAKAVFFDYA